MNSSIGGVKLPSTTGYSIGWSGFGASSGGGYNFREIKAETASTEVESVDVEGKTWSGYQKAYNESDYKRGRNVTGIALGLGLTFGRMNPLYGGLAAMATIVISEFTKKTNTTNITSGTSALAAWGVKQVSKDVMTGRDWYTTFKQLIFQRELRLSEHVAQDVGLETVNKYYTVPEGGIRMGLVGLFIDSGTNILVGVFSSVAKDKVKGKDIDWGDTFKKTGVKQLPTIGTSLIALLAFKGKDGKRQTDLAKAISSKIFDSKGAIKLLRETDEYKDLAKALDQNLLGKGKIKTFFGKKFNQFKLNKFETRMFEKDVWKIGSGIGKDAAKGFMQTVGSEMAIGFGVDAAVSIGANVLVGCLLEGKSFGESLKDSQWGEEILKSAVKMVCTKSFELIFSSFGCGALGKVIGSAVASFVNAYVCEPFRNKDGEIDQGWCAAAGCAVIGGGILAGCIAAAAVSSCVPPVGWIVGLAILAGAAIAYCAVVVAHWVVENWDAITGFFQDNLITPIVDFLDEAGNFIASVGEAAMEVLETKECKIFLNVICLGIPALFGYC